MNALMLQSAGLGFGIVLGCGLLGLYIRWVRDSFRSALI